MNEVHSHPQFSHVLLQVNRHDWKLWIQGMLLLCYCSLSIIPGACDYPQQFGPQSSGIRQPGWESKNGGLWQTFLKRGGYLSRCQFAVSSGSVLAVPRARGVCSGLGWALVDLCPHRTQECRGAFLPLKGKISTFSPSGSSPLSLLKKPERLKA